MSKQYTVVLKCYIAKALQVKYQIIARRLWNVAVCRVGEHQHWPAHWCSHIHKVKHNGIWEWGAHGLNGWGRNDKVGYSFWEICLKSTGLQGSTLSGHRMTTAFGPFEFPTRGLLQKGCDRSPPKACFEEPSSWLAFTVLWIFKVLYNWRWNSMGGVIIILTRRIGETMYGLLLLSHLGGASTVCKSALHF